MGRLHPLAVHLPIGIFLLLGALELSTWLSGRRALAWLPALDERMRGLIIGCGAAAALLAAALGWALSRDGGYDPALLARHRALGLALAGAACALLVCHGLGWRRLRAAAFGCVLLQVFVAGHSGGTLTHGAGYLADVFVTPKPKISSPFPADPQRALVYAQLIQPILAQKCASCHGPAKSKGDLRLDSWAAIAQGGHHGAVLKPGDSAGSPLFRRVSLDPDNKEHMPPSGKPQLADDEIALLSWWIDSGAPERKTIAEMDAPPDIAAAAAALCGQASDAPAIPDRAAMLAAGQNLAGKLGIIIRPLTPDGPWLEVDGHILLGQFGNTQLAALAPIAPAIERLELGETAVTDQGLAAISQMRQLRRLDLDRTAVSDAGLAQLASLQQLQELNLFGTAVSDAGMGALRSLPRLRTLYLWQTQVTASGAAALAARYAGSRTERRREAELAQIEEKIRADAFHFDLGGAALPAAAPTTPAPAPPSS